MWQLSVYRCWTLIVFWCWIAAAIYVARFWQGKWRQMRVIEVESKTVTHLAVGHSREGGNPAIER